MILLVAALLRQIWRFWDGWPFLQTLEIALKFPLECFFLSLYLLYLLEAWNEITFWYQIYASLLWARFILANSSYLQGPVNLLPPFSGSQGFVIALQSFPLWSTLNARHPVYFYILSGKTFTLLSPDSWHGQASSIYSQLLKCSWFPCQENSSFNFFDGF